MLRSKLSLVACTKRQCSHHVDTRPTYLVGPFMLVFGIGKDLFNPSILEICCMIVQRELKLDGAIGQEEICNFLISEIFSKSFLSHIGKNK